MDPKQYRKKMSEARILLGFAAEIYLLQLQGGRHFLHDHPQGATSWQESAIKKVLRHPTVGTTVAHLCQFGMTTKHGGQSVPVRKATRFMMSAPAILETSTRTCQGGHKHVPRLDDRAKKTAVYPPMLCRPILEGIDKQRQRDGGGTLPVFLQQNLDSGAAIYNLDQEATMEVTLEAGDADIQHEFEAMAE